MSTTGEVKPNSATTSAVGGEDLAWQSLTNVLSDDAAGVNVTAANFDAGILTQILKVTNFGFGVSAAATINGVIAHIEQWGTASIITTSCQLLGTDREVSGTNKSGLSTGFSATTQVKSFGSSTDPWGCVLTPAIVNDNNFGLAIRCKSLAANSDIWIDYVSLEIIYDLPSETNATNVKFIPC